MGFTGMLNEKQENIYPNSPEYLSATFWNKVHNLTLGYWCKAVTGLCGASRSLLDKLQFSVGGANSTIKSQNSTKTLNAHSLNILQQPFRADTRTFSCQIQLTSEYNLDDVRKGDCLPFHMAMTAVSGTYFWLAVGLHVISG